MQNKIDAPKWFLNGFDDVRSSYFLEDNCCQKYQTLDYLLHILIDTHQRHTQVNNIMELIALSEDFGSEEGRDASLTELDELLKAVNKANGSAKNKNMKGAIKNEDDKR